MPLTTAKKAEIIAKFQHMKRHPKDFHSRRGLLQLVGQRRRFLGYIKAQDFERYRKIITELGLRR